MAAGILTTRLGPVGAACGPACPSDSQPTNGTVTATDGAGFAVGTACANTAPPSARAARYTKLARTIGCAFMRAIIATAVAFSLPFEPRLFPAFLAPQTPLTPLPPLLYLFIHKSAVTNPRNTIAI